MAQRYDRALMVDATQLTPEGYLEVKACPISRTGSFPYLYSDGTQMMEAKLPSELYAASTIQSANNKPITNDHPSEAVTAANYSQYAKGMTSGDAQVVDDRLSVSLTVTDQDTIAAIQAGKRELSIGFTCDVVADSGDYEGQHYDAVQRNIQINHVAVVDQGRAGNTVAIKGDSATMIIDGAPNIKKEGTHLKIKIDGKDVEASQEMADAFNAVSEKVTSLTADVSAKDQEIGKLTGSRDALQAKVDSLETDLTEAKKSALTDSAIEAKVADRLSLLDKAKPILGDAYDFTGKTDQQVKVDTIAATNDKFVADGKSDGYIDGYFDNVVEAAVEDGNVTPATFTGTHGDSANANVTKMRSARQNMFGGAK